MTASAHQPLPPKTEPPTRTITVLGRELRLKTDEDPQRLRELASYVDETIAAVGQGKQQPNQVDQQVLLVSLLRLANDVYKLRDEKRELTSVLKKSTRALLGRIPT